MLRSAPHGGRSHPAYRGLVALIATALELPAPAAVDPTIRFPMMAMARAHPVAVMPHVFVAAPLPIAGAQTYPTRCRGNDFDSRRRRRNLDDDRFRVADDRYRDRPQAPALQQRFEFALTCDPPNCRLSLRQSPGWRLHGSNNAYDCAGVDSPCQPLVSRRRSLRVT